MVNELYWLLFLWFSSQQGEGNAEKFDYVSKKTLLHFKVLTILKYYSIPKFHKDENLGHTGIKPMTTALWAPRAKLLYIL